MLCLFRSAVQGARARVLLRFHGWNHASPSCQDSSSSFFFYPVLWNQLTFASVGTQAGTETLLQAAFKITGKTERQERPESQSEEVDGKFTLKMRRKSRAEGFSQLYSQPTWNSRGDSDVWLVLLHTPKRHRESSFSHQPHCWTCCVQRFWWGYWWDESNRLVKSFLTFSICDCRIQVIPTLRDLGRTIADVHLHSECISLHDTGSNGAAPTAFV